MKIILFIVLGIIMILKNKYYMDCMRKKVKIKKSLIFIDAIVTLLFFLLLLLALLVLTQISYEKKILTTGNICFFIIALLLLVLKEILLFYPKKWGWVLISLIDFIYLIILL